MSDTLVLNASGRPVNLLPPSVFEWQDAIRAQFLGNVVVVAEYEDWNVHSPSTTFAVPSIIMSKRHLYVDRTVGFKDTLMFLRDRYTCQYCLKVFPSNRLTQDHVLPRKYGGLTSWDNIVTACGPCNSRRGCNRSIRPAHEPWQPSYYELVKIRKEYPLVIPCQDWVDYLDWPPENLFIKGTNILPIKAAA